MLPGAASVIARVFMPGANAAEPPLRSLSTSSADARRDLRTRCSPSPRRPHEIPHCVVVFLGSLPEHRVTTTLVGFEEHEPRVGQ